ncbi:MAG: hypothetical protein JNL38_02295 [Myxococcales bacterium]|nr:hypothetical protein [Myxococcales bacterium]
MSEGAGRTRRIAYALGLGCAAPLAVALSCAPFDDAPGPASPDGGADAPASDGAPVGADGGPGLDAGGGADADAALEPPTAACTVWFRGDRGVFLDGVSDGGVRRWDNQCTASKLVPALATLGGTVHPVVDGPPPGVAFRSPTPGATNFPVLTSGESADTVLTPPLTIYAAFRIDTSNGTVANALLDVVGNRAGLGWEFGNGQLLFHVKSNGTTSLVGASAPAAVPKLYLVAGQLTASEIALYLDDPVIPANKTPVMAALPTLAGLSVGASRVGNANLNGTIYEILGYSEAHDVDARKAVFDYLRARYRP